MVVLIKNLKTGEIMSKPEKLITDFLTDYAERAEEANHGLCKIIDSMTDEDSRPLPYANTELIEALRDIAYGLFEMHHIVIPEDKIHISKEFKG
jgi:hypothetical protein